MTTSASTLITHWRSQNLRIAPGNTEERVRDFESRNGVILPPDFRDYFLTVDGMAQIGGHDCDPIGFAFWPLRRIRSVTEECTAQKIEPPANSELEKYFVFADYLQWSWAYAIDLGTPAAGTNRVIHVGTLRPNFVADSFTHFVTLYLHDAPELYPSAGADSNR